MTIPWVEKYRPSTLNEVVGQDEIVQRLKQYNDITQLPHLMFIGRPGVGKTATARTLAKNLNISIVEFNASDDRGIEFIRNQVRELLQTKSPKLILLDEADNLTNESQNALRRPMEHAINNTKNRIIFTVNNSNKIIGPIYSRCANYEFKTLDEDSAVLMLAKVIKKEGIATEMADSLETLEKLLKELARYTCGDMRQAIQTLEDMYNNGGQLTEEKIQSMFTSATICEEVISNAMDGDWEEALNKLEDVIVENEANHEKVVEELREASTEIKSPILKSRFLESLKHTDVALSYPTTNTLVQLSDLIVKLYVYTHTTEEV